MKFALIEHWKTVLFGAWSARFTWIMVGLNALDASYSYFVGYAPLPAWGMGLVNGALAMLILWARVTLQKKLQEKTNGR